MELDFPQKLGRMIDGTLIFKNEKKDALACLETLEIIIRNLVNYPQELKYKNIKEKSKALQRILCCSGGQDLLIFLGALKKVHQFESHFVWENNLRIKDLELAAALPIIAFYKTKLAGVPQETLKSKLEREKEAKNQILIEIQNDRKERLERIEQQRIAREMSLTKDLEQERARLQKTMTSEQESELLEKRQRLAGRMQLPSVTYGATHVAAEGPRTESDEDS